jgi:hypothetical protein
VNPGFPGGTVASPGNTVREAAILALFLFATGLALWPLLKAPASVLPDLGDSLHNIWIYAGNLIRLGDGRILDFFDAGIFFPQRLTAAYSEFQPLNTIVFGAFWLLTGSSIAAYNLLVYLSFAATGYTTHLLARQLGAGIAMAIFVGVAVAFFPYRFSHLPHAQALSLQWAILPLLFFMLYLRSGRRSQLAAFAGLFFLQMASIGYTSLYLATGFLAMFGAAWLGSREQAGRYRLAVVAKVVAIIALLVIPFYLPYVTLAMEGSKRGLDELASYGVDLALLTATPGENLAYGRITQPLRSFRPDGPISGVFPGFGVLLVWVLGVVGAFRLYARGPDGAPARRWQADGAIDHRYVIAGLAIAGVFLALLAMGPIIKLRGSAVMLSPAYPLFKHIPVFSAFRYLPNHMQAVVLFVGLAAAGSCSAIGLRWGWRTLLVVSLACLGLFEYRAVVGTTTAPLILEKPEPVYLWLRTQPRGAVLELPATVPGRANDPWELMQFQYQLGALVHRQPIANGASGFRPKASNDLFIAAGSFPSVGSLVAMRQFGVKYVLIHRDLSSELWQKAARAVATGRLSVAYEDGRSAVYRITEQMTKPDELVPIVATPGARAGFAIQSCSPLVKANALARIVVNVENVGTSPWRASTVGIATPPGKGEVRIGVREWARRSDGFVPRDPAGNPLNGRGMLDDDVLPGEKRQIAFDIPVPREEGLYRVKFGLVQELVAWFPQREADCDIEVR